jgi:protein-S-isoprenylcysteine O-methyltransferase Ste14
MNILAKHLRDFLIPIIVTIILPLLINRTEQRQFSRPLIAPSVLQIMAGVLVGLAGLALMISSIILMIRIAKSTIMPWDPSQNLVVVGPYRHLRNPMILGVILLLLGEALVLSSYGISLLAMAFFILNTVYFICFEEPQLEKQFGEAYRQYKAHVPRWVPRIRPWHPQESSSENTA